MDENEKSKRAEEKARRKRLKNKYRENSGKVYTYRSVKKGDKFVLETSLVDSKANTDAETSYTTSAQTHTPTQFMHYVLFTSQVSFVFSCFMIFMWLFYTTPVPIYTKSIPFDSLDSEKPVTIDSIKIPENWRACEMEFSNDLYMRTSEYFETILTAEITNEKGELAGEMEGDMYRNLYEGYLEQSEPIRQTFNLKKGGFLNVDVFLQRVKGLKNIVNGTKINIPNAYVTLKVYPPTRLWGNYLFWSSITCFLIWSVLYTWYKDAWAEVVVIAFFVAFTALMIWLD
jgi:hypothetical protein